MSVFPKAAIMIFVHSNDYNAFSSNDHCQTIHRCNEPVSPCGGANITPLHRAVRTSEDPPIKRFLTAQERARTP